jgi:hypothetical protein
MRMSCTGAKHGGKSSAAGDTSGTGVTSSSRKASGAISLICRLTKHSTHQQTAKGGESGSEGSKLGGEQGEGEEEGEKELVEVGWEELGTPVWYYLDPFGE